MHKRNLIETQLRRMQATIILMFVAMFMSCDVTLSLIVK